MSKTYFGVDISEHNGTVDWNALSKKVDFAILRIGWVGNNKNKMDIKFNENYAAAKKAGVKLGAYVYMYSKTTEAAKNGAEWILKQIKGKEFDMPIYCDMEDPTIASLGKSTLTAITEAFNSVIEKAGYRVGIYASRFWFDSKLNASVKKYHTWIAHYGPSGTEKYRGSYEMWQNSSDGKVSGVKGRVDTNYLYAYIFNSKPVGKQETKPLFKSNATMLVKSDVFADNTKTLYVGKVNKGERVKLLAAGSKNAIIQYAVNDNQYKVGIVLTKDVKVD